jgi:hypothetical protein
VHLLVRAGDPGGADDQYVDTVVDQRACHLREPEVVAVQQADRERPDGNDAQLGAIGGGDPCVDLVRLPPGERVVEVQLVVGAPHGAVRTDDDHAVVGL